MTQELMNENCDVTDSFRFKRETVHTFMADHGPLYKKHCEEVGWFKEDEPEMMWNDYFVAETSGMLRIYSVRLADLKLIGYGIFFVRRNLHYAKTIIAGCDMIYILPEFRGGTGEHFIAWIDKGLKSEGVNAVTHHAKVYYDFGSMLTRLEYKHVENIYIRRLQ